MSATENRKWTRSDFLRYRSGEMTGSERNAFERMLQRDPFAAEALEGLELVSAQEAAKDLADLTGRIGRREMKLKRFYYSAAAAAVLLLGISSLLIFRSGPGREVQLAGDALKTESVADSLTAVPPVARTETKSSDKVEYVIGDEAKQEKMPVAIKSSEPAAKSSEADVTRKIIVPDSIGKNLITDTVAAGYNQVLKIPGRVDVVRSTTRDNLTEEALRVRVATAPLQGKVSGIVISSEDNLPIPFAAVTIKGTTVGTVAGIDGRFTLPVTSDTGVTLVTSFIGMETVEQRVKGSDTLQIRMKTDIQAMDEVVVVGYGSQKKEESEVFYKAPVPVDGFNEFYNYLEESLIWPAEVIDITRAVVIVDLPVSKYGVRGVPVIVRSPGDSFSAEAKRVINRGPEWVPAIRNNQAVDDTVRIRLVFRKRFPAACA